MLAQERQAADAGAARHPRRGAPPRGLGRVFETPAAQLSPLGVPPLGEIEDEAPSGPMGGPGAQPLETRAPTPGTQQHRAPGATVQREYRISARTM